MSRFARCSTLLVALVAMLFAGLGLVAPAAHAQDGSEPAEACNQSQAPCALSVSPVLPVRVSAPVDVTLDLVCDGNKVRVSAADLGTTKLQVALDGFDVVSLRDLPSGDPSAEVLLGDGSLTNRGLAIDHEIEVRTDQDLLVVKAAVQGCVLASLEPAADCASINVTLANGGLRSNPYAFQIISDEGVVQMERVFDQGRGASAGFQTNIAQEFSRSRAVIFEQGGGTLTEVDLGAACGAVRAELYPSCESADAYLTLRNASPWDQVMDIYISDDQRPLGVEVPSLTATEVGLALPGESATIEVAERDSGREVLRSVVNTNCGAADLSGFAMWRGVDGSVQAGLVSTGGTPTEVTLRQGDSLLDTVLVSPDEVAVVQLEDVKGGAVTAQGSDGNEETLTLPGEAGDGSGISDWLKGTTLVVLVGAALLFEIALLTVILPRRRRERNQGE